MNVIREGAIAVLPRSTNMVDVFVGIGWGNRSLFGVKQGQLTLLKGSPITPDQAAVVLKAMS